MDEVKPCPFCGEKLIKKTEVLKCSGKTTFYEHPYNSCVLATNTDEFSYIVLEGNIEAWNKRIEAK